MSAAINKNKMIEWLDPNEMHEASLKWMSELKFIRDEQLFLNDLVKSYTSQLTDSAVFKESKEIIGAITSAEKEVIALMKKVQAHENQLEIMLDQIDQLKMEQAYTETHWELNSEMAKYSNQYRELKSRLFKLVTKVMKKDKGNRLLN
ncbi:hypothetical protein QSE00_09660 [Arenibacter sp. M-2]|uniref:hypothetical protein n=1 Tax=unclassified Arenibacter TaxID=2615047 RepID=UPI000D760CBC|nr:MULTISPECIES: hypothetical protein [unclassified Arenibacter]MDL5512078.1 hypothetical protein [Arenibacter sp. M-2]PXX22362.1 hypothetical protein C7972_12533 [Arenibacter sp. ARW7G5Y1]